MAQQAGNLALNGRLDNVRFLIRDRDAKYTVPFDAVFRSEGVEIVRTPIRAPRANAYAGTLVRTVRAECLDWILVLGRRHLEGILRSYVDHYNRARPHRGLALSTPKPRTVGSDADLLGRRIVRRSILGGLITMNTERLPDRIWVLAPFTIGSFVRRPFVLVADDHDGAFLGATLRRGEADPSARRCRYEDDLVLQKLMLSGYGGGSRFLESSKTCPANARRCSGAET